MTKCKNNNNRSFLKNKIGSFVIMGVIVIPLIFTLLITVAGGHLRNRNVSIKYQMSLDTFMYAVANQYSHRYDANDFTVCMFYEKDLNEINERLYNYIINLDGYYSDDLWSASVEIKTNQELGGGSSLYDKSKHKDHCYLVATLNAVLPNVNNLSTYKSYYANNNEEWQTRISEYEKNNKTNQMIYVNINSISSAF